MLNLLRGLFPPEGEVISLAMQSDPLLLEKAVRIDTHGQPIDLILGKKTLRLYPELRIHQKRQAETGDWLLVDSERFSSEIAGFARIRRGETLVVGRANESLGTLFDLPKSVMKRHLALTNDNGRLLLRPLEGQKASYVRAVDDAAELQRIAAQRRKNLRRLTRIFGGPIELLEPEEALATIEQFLALLESETYRPLDSRGRPGGLLELPDRLTPIIVGDLHASLDNLLKVLSEGCYLQALRDDTAALLILGDAVHSEADGELEEMQSSLLMLDLICKLKIRFPANVFYLRGNHESFDESVGKAGVPQGRVLLQKAQALRGNNYVKRLGTCFDSLACLARSRDFIAVHAGPPREKVSTKHLINLHERPRLASELRWIRLRHPARPGGYGKKHVRALRDALGTDRHTPVIVGHTPQSAKGTVWLDAGDIKNHHIVYDARAESLAVMVRVGREMIALEYPGEPGLLAYANELQTAKGKSGPLDEADRSQVA